MHSFIRSLTHSLVNINVFIQYSNNAKYFGGIVSFSASDMKRINGYPNVSQVAPYVLWTMDYYFHPPF